MSVGMATSIVASVVSVAFSRDRENASAMSRAHLIDLFIVSNTSENTAMNSSTIDIPSAARLNTI